jgi:prevent-host-death family protein
VITVNIHEAKTHLSRLLQRVAAGEEVIIARAGRPLARLVPVTGTTARRVPGTAKGLLVLRENFDEPLPDDVLDDFER